jgi:hypothetical protein
MDDPTSPRALTAPEFFAKNFPGFSMTDAQLATGIAYSTVHAVAHGRRTPTLETAEKLQRWSLAATAEHGVYISAARTLGIEEPTFSAQVAR